MKLSKHINYGLEVKFNKINFYYQITLGLAIRELLNAKVNPVNFGITPMCFYQISWLFDIF